MTDIAWEKIKEFHEQGKTDEAQRLASRWIAREFNGTSTDPPKPKTGAEND
jgi:hypothetical protein